MRGLPQRPVIITALILLALFAFCAVQFPFVLSTRVLGNLLTDNAYLGVIAVGMTVVIISGGIDLSVGSVLAFVGVMLLSLRTAGGLFWLTRTRRDDIEPLSPEMLRQCEIVQQRMGLQRHIRYGQTRSLDSPVHVGWFRPIV